MSLNAVKMLGISITNDPKNIILEEIQKYLENRSSLGVGPSSLRPKPFVIVTPNPEQVVLAQKDTRFAKILNQADVAIPDGIGLVWASRLVNGSQFTVHSKTIQEKIAGVDLMEDLVTLAAKEGYPIALIGGRGGLAVNALECLQAKYPRLSGWAEDGSEITIESTNLPAGEAGLQIYKSTKKETNIYFEQLARRIKETNMKMVFVGLGAPKQELLISVLSSQLSEKLKTEKHSADNRKPITDNRIVFMSIGGSFDIIAGRTPRAPQLIRSIGFEWLWRLILEPWRWKRQLALLQFGVLVVKEKLQH